MILLTLSTVIKDVSVEVQGEANNLEEITETWETFLLSTHQVEYGKVTQKNIDLDIHPKNISASIPEVV